MREVSKVSILHSIKFIINHPLNRKNKLGAILRFIKWQIGSRIVPGSVILNWIGESKIIASPGESGITGNIYCWLHDFSEMAFVLHANSEDSLFIDIGANVGSYTVLACAVRGAKGICIEPIPTTFKRLMANIQINNLSERVKTYNLGVSNVEGLCNFTMVENCTNHVVLNGANPENSIKVKVITLDKLLLGCSPSMMKIDVEGFEFQVINGAHETLQSNSLNSVILELNGSGNQYGHSDESIIDAMKKYGFSTYHYEPFTRDLIPLDGKSINSGNTIFIRNISEVRSRILQAPKYLIGDDYV